MALFASRGYGATSVADIEEAVGLKPRRGGLYKHFSNKYDLLETAVRERAANLTTIAAQLDGLDLADAAGGVSRLRGPLVALGRSFLGEMDRHEELTRLLEHDATRVPELTARIKRDIVDLGYRTAARLIAVAAPDLPDPDVMAIVVLGPLVALRRTAWTFGAAPLDIDDERFLDGWATTMLASLENSQATAARSRHRPRRHRER